MAETTAQTVFSFHHFPEYKFFRANFRVLFFTSDACHEAEIGRSSDAEVVFTQRHHQ